MTIAVGDEKAHIFNLGGGSQGPEINEIGTFGLKLRSVKDL